MVLLSMESIYRHLLHEESVVQGDRLNGKLQSSIEYHRRDLATILETAKWQVFLGTSIRNRSIIFFLMYMCL